MLLVYKGGFNMLTCLVILLLALQSHHVVANPDVPGEFVCLYSEGIGENFFSKFSKLK